MSARRLGADRRGAASLEFAVAGIVVVVLTLAVFDVALLFMAQRGLDHGVNRAARWAAVNSGGLSAATVLSQFQAAAAATLPNAGSCTAYTALADVPGGAACSIVVDLSGGTTVGSMVTIQASYRWSPVNAITGLTVATLQSSAALPIQH